MYDGVQRVLSNKIICRFVYLSTYLLIKSGHFDLIIYPKSSKFNHPQFNLFILLFATFHSATQSRPFVCLLTLILPFIKFLFDYIPFTYHLNPPIFCLNSSEFEQQSYL